MQLNYKEFGSGFPLIILHGLFGMLDNWQTFARKMSDTYSVYIIDLRNHGRSAWADEINYPVMADDLFHFMNDKWIYEAYIMGHSMGGKVAIEFALEHPDYCRKLVSVDMGIKQHYYRHLHIFDALKKLKLEEFQSRASIFNELKKSVKSEAVVHFLMKNIRRNKTRKCFELKMNLDAIINNYDQILEPIHGDFLYDSPSLFIRGSESDYIVPEDFDEIKEKFSGAEFAEIQGAGHWIHSDKPLELETVVREFLKE